MNNYAQELNEFNFVPSDDFIPFEALLADAARYLLTIANAGDLQYRGDYVFTKGVPRHFPRPGNFGDDSELAQEYVNADEKFFPLPIFVNLGLVEVPDQNVAQLPALPIDPVAIHPIAHLSEATREDFNEVSQIVDNNEAYEALRRNPLGNHCRQGELFVWRIDDGPILGYVVLTTQNVTMDNLSLKSFPAISHIAKLGTGILGLPMVEWVRARYPTSRVLVKNPLRESMRFWRNRCLASIDVLTYSNLLFLPRLP
jgi:hypothetical protein